MPAKKKQLRCNPNHGARHKGSVAEPLVVGGFQGRSPKERVPQGQSQKGTFLLRLDHVKANKARVTKAVSVKDAGYDDPEDGNNKEAITSSKAGDGIARAAIVKASLGKFGHCVVVRPWSKSTTSSQTAADR